MAKSWQPAPPLTGAAQVGVKGAALPLIAPDAAVDRLMANGEFARAAQVARCIYYKDGSEGADFPGDLPAFGPTSAVASLSLGAEREFVFRSTSDAARRFSIHLSPGSLLFVGEGCQEIYEHALLRNERCDKPRLNLTFRKYGRG